MHCYSCRLSCFPTAKNDLETRKLWIEACHRQSHGSSIKLMEPGKDDRVCSHHFVDGKPTPDNPCPEIFDEKSSFQHIKDAKKKIFEKRRKRLLDRKACIARRENTIQSSIGHHMQPTIVIVKEDELTMLRMRKQIEELKNKNKELNNENNALKMKLTAPETKTVNDTSLVNLERPTDNTTLVKLGEKTVLTVTVKGKKNELLHLDNQEESPEETTIVQLGKKGELPAFSEQQRRTKVPGNLKLGKARSDITTIVSELQFKRTFFQTLLVNSNDVKHWTSLRSLNLFNGLHDLIAPDVGRRWEGLKKSCDRSMKKNASDFFVKRGPTRKLDSKDEFLLMLMKLKHGYTYTDLGKRFEISSSLVSRIFHCWLDAMSQTIGKTVRWCTREEIDYSKPSFFNHLPNIRAFIECSEFHMETSKNRAQQNITFSNDNNHNTAKFLVAIAPHSQITFISPMYGGGTSDSEIATDSGILDLCAKGDMIIAGQDFNILEECAKRDINLYVPYGFKRDNDLVSFYESEGDDMRCADIINSEMLMENIIQRIKAFKILSNKIPITLIPFIQKMVLVCAAICNLEDPVLIE